MAAKKTQTKSVQTDNSNKKTLAIVGLIVNIVVLPGLGSIIGGRTKTGVVQLVLFILGIPLAIIIVGFFLMFAMWVWGIVTGVQMVQEAE